MHAHLVLRLATKKVKVVSLNNSHLAQKGERA